MRRRFRTTPFGPGARPRNREVGRAEFFGAVGADQRSARQGTGETLPVPFDYPPSFFDWMTIKWYLPYSLAPSVKSTSISSR